MRFYSRLKSPSYVMFHAGQRVIEISAGNNILRPIKVGMLRFKQIPPSDTGAKISLKGNVVNGILDSDKAAEELRKAGHKVTDKSGRDITEAELCRFLRSHDRYGDDFVTIDDEESKNLLDEIWMVEGVGEWFCTLCERTFSSQAKVRYHCRQSESHQEKLKTQGQHVVPQSQASQHAVA